MSPESHGRTPAFAELLCMYRVLPLNYVVLDLETTGLFDDLGAPSILTVGLVRVSDGEVVEALEFKARPHRSITSGAKAVHGISEMQAHAFPPLCESWEPMSSVLCSQMIVAHNAGFDWAVLDAEGQLHNLQLPEVLGVFCSQKAAFPWALATGLETSARGPSLDVLTEHLGLRNYRAEISGMHSALVDARQTAGVVEALRELADPQFKGLH